MSVRINNQNQAINNNKKKQIENSKNNKPSGSSAYSKNKKFLDKMLREYQAFCKNNNLPEYRWRTRITEVEREFKP